MDEAFLRRIQYKIFAESPTVEDFKHHLRGLLPRSRRDRRNPASSSRCSCDYYRPRNIPLRGCHPRDLIKQALSLASYLRQTAAPHRRSAGSGVQQLLRERPRRISRLRLI